MKRGRPSTYNSKYCMDIVIWMARGFSIKSFAGKINVDEKTIYRWSEKYDDFCQSIKRGRAKSVLYWEQIGMLGMMGKIPNFNATIWIFQMKNRLGWSDKLTVDPEESYLEEEKKIVETPRDTLKRLMKKYGKQIEAITRD